MTGIAKLSAFLDEHGLTQTAFAELAGVPGPQVSMWLSGRRCPGLASALKIEQATNGEVPASSWVKPRRAA
jgi:DNA-binding transcriptional regulator YdaS (Cro superfamily)